MTTTTIQLRDPIADDIPIFFEHQLDPLAIHMAAFTADDPTDRSMFNARWQRILSSEEIIKKTVLFNGEVAGHILQFTQFGNPSVGYWLGRDYWGKGIMSAALKQFLALIPTRPLYARAAKDNHASIRVLEKCGFVIEREDSGFAHGRGKETIEVLLKLEA